MTCRPEYAIIEILSKCKTKKSIRLVNNESEISVMEEQEKKISADKLAYEIMIYSRDQLMVAMPFLNRAFYRMPMVSDGRVAAFATDGERIYYNTDHVLHLYRQQKEAVVRAYMHMVFHCIFCHPFAYEKMEGEYWDMAADIAVENAILDLKKQNLGLADDEQRRRYLYDLKEEIQFLTAEKIYRYFRKHEDRAQDWLEKGKIFTHDTHLRWLPKESSHREMKSGTDSYMHMVANPLGCNQADEGGTEAPDEPMEIFAGKTSEDWKEIGEGAKMNLETFLKDQGINAGSMIYNLDEVLREKYDYTDFLKKFAVTGEEMHINDEEFDYIYYTYGLKLYENMPLIEPLEYRENKRIRDFVIAIDTSGSCQGATVKKFLNKTYSILKSSESFFSKVNIHIIQCDSEIQQEVKITDIEEFEHYVENMVLAGFGGTDFRPVFKYVDELVKRHEFQELRGLIYFTDGRGTFPEKMPDYRTAFVFVEDGFDMPQVPAWAIKLVLGEEEFE